MASLACFYKNIPVGHVEAGLRTGNIFSPWPEEFNRRLTGLVAKFHFAATAKAAQNLIDEKIPKSAIHVTGNTVIDALLQVLKKIQTNPLIRHELKNKFSFMRDDKKKILVTCHRRENFGSR